MSQKLRSIMTRNIVTAKPTDTIKSAAESMNMHEIGCLIVVDQEKPVGIITERDMLKRIINECKNPEKTKIIDVMSKPLITASPNMRAGDATKLMLERGIKKLPVVQNGHLVGLVTLTDLLRTEGVIQFLNKLSLNGASKRIKKMINIYCDPMKLHRRTCPLIMKDGFAFGCQLGKCMWWLGDECAVTKLSHLVLPEGIPEPEMVQE